MVAQARQVVALQQEEQQVEDRDIASVSAFADEAILKACIVGLALKE